MEMALNLYVKLASGFVSAFYEISVVLKLILKTKKFSFIGMRSL